MRRLDVQQSLMKVCCVCVCCFFVQEEDGIGDLVRSRGLGDVYKRQVTTILPGHGPVIPDARAMIGVYRQHRRDRLELSLLHI